MLKAAIIGCGKISDAHASQILRVPGAEIVGVCDREPLMAEQLCRRYPVKNRFADVESLISKGRPDVVHITTPPEGHFEIAKYCLDSGVNVYVEKPFTLFADQAEALLSFAERKRLKVTVGHDDQFSNVARRMRNLVAAGYVGTGAVHMESYYCYELGQSAYVRALLSDSKHWVRRLPGKLLHNIISHGIARIAEFLTGESVKVIAHGFTSPFLSEMGEKEIVDELRVIIRDDASTTAYFTFSSQMRPALHQFRLYGNRNGLVLDQDQETLIKLSGSRHKSYLEKFAPCGSFSGQYLSNLKTNLGTFAANQFHSKAGMKFLIESFYRSIRDDAPVPIPYREILLTSRIMDEIFSQISTGTLVASPTRASLQAV